MQGVSSSSLLPPRTASFGAVFLLPFRTSKQGVCDEKIIGCRRSFRRNCRYDFCSASIRSFFRSAAGDRSETAFRNAAVETVSGRIEANPQVSESCTLKTVSGAVDICLKEKVSVEAESYGSVSVYGNDFGNRAVIRLSDSPVIAAESVSGRITVRTANDESPSRDSRQP